jgi:hypothetical protein
MPKVAILHPGVYQNPKNDALTTSFLADVTVVRYVAGMTKEELLTTVREAIPEGLTHVSFVYHYPGYSRLPFFPDTSGKQPKYQYFSDAAIEILRSVSLATDGLTVDILACDLKEAAYAEEVKKIETELGINIRYSVDKTGNPSSSANWTLESEEPAVSVLSTYFTDGVLAWDGVLAGNKAPIIKAGGIPYSNYILWNGSNTFTVIQDFAWSALGFDATDYIELSGNEIFNGANKKIAISGEILWEGLITISASVTDLSGAPLIKNLGVINGDITSDYGGAIIRRDQKFFKIENCYSTGEIFGIYAGGIAGAFSGQSVGSCTITNCYSTGAITGLSAGGIAGSNAGYDISGSCDISGCYSTGIISGISAGGIVGNIAGDASGSCTITNCYSTGDVIGPIAGGIAGDGAGQLGGECTISGCYSLGDIIGADAGGIAGASAGNDGICTITDCYNTGDIIGQNAGGIVGASAGTDGTCDISGCYSTGAISGGDAGGIVGSNAGDNGMCTISECYSTGPIGGGGAGGIAGSNAGGNSSCIISNCYSTGAIGGGGAGGIVGANAAPTSGTTCTITDCYSAGDNSVVTAGGIAGSNAGATCTITCCVCNGGTIFGNGIPTDPLDCSTDLADISGVIFPCWIPSLIWESGGPVAPTNYNLPILTRFRNSPWDSAFYNAADDPAKFITPILTNTFPLRVNPYIAIGNILVYTNEFIRALVAGTTLPNPGRTAWSNVPLPAGTLLRPLGRFVVVNGANKLAIYRFENIQLINGSSSEGIPSGDTTGRWYTGWICTWSADGVAPVFP